MKLGLGFYLADSFFCLIIVWVWRICVMSLDLQISADEEQDQESGTERVFSAPQCVLQTFLQSLQPG